MTAMASTTVTGTNVDSTDSLSLDQTWLGKDTKSLRDAIERDYIEMVQGNATVVQNMVDLHMFLFDRMKQFENTNSVNSDLLRQATNKIGSLSHEVRSLNYENSLLNHKLASIEDATRSMYLRVDGIKGVENENLKQKVAKTLSRTGVNCTQNDLDFVRRLGKAKQGSDRTILVRFVKESLRNSILFNKANLGRDRNAPIWINDDVSELTRKNRKTVRDVVTLAKQSGLQNIKIHSDGVVIGGSKFRHKDLDLLPPNLSVAKAKTREDDEDIFFQSESSPLSNFYQSRIIIRDLVFDTAEQAFQFRKAKAHGKVQLANKIAINRNPTIAKQLGNFPTTKAWKEQEANVMSEILLAKFSQDSKMAQFLINTSGKRLHEATSDKKWAIGADLSSKALRNDDWNGLDLLGQLLENTRDVLIATGNFAPPTDQTVDLDQSQGDFEYATPLSDDEGSNYEELEYVDHLK